MNRFLIEDNPRLIARSLCDQHIVKRPLEEAQMLCTSLWHHAPKYAEEKKLYRPVHQKHPCTLWAMKTRQNYAFAFKMYKEMLDEYTFRYKKQHGASKLWDALYDGTRYIPQGPLTKHPECFGKYEEFKTDMYWPITSYRKFSIADKNKFARYNNGTSRPEWFVKE